MGRPHLGQRKQVNVRFPLDLIAQIDQARGFISRDAWMEKAARLALRPIARGHDPDLQAVIHEHNFAIPFRTEYKDGVRTRIFGCQCGAEQVE